MLIFILLILLYLLSLFIFLYRIKKENENLINKIIILIKNDNYDFKNKYINLKINKDFLNGSENKLELIKNKMKNDFDIIKLFHPMDITEKKKIRIGIDRDGGYILLDDFKDIKIAYSFGISREISFDKELADRNIDVYMYDHTISKLPFENKKFHWKKIGLSSIKKKNMKTLQELLEENGHLNEQNMILKMDIESYEWGVFKELPLNILKQFKYIVGEFHFTNENKNIYLNILKKIEITHQIIHLHCNNCASQILDYYGFQICSLLEITFALKEGFEFKKFSSNFPINGLDYKNCKHKTDCNNLLNIFI